MNLGKDFENQVRESVLLIPNVYYLRLNDPPQSFTQHSDTKFSKQNPYDCLIYQYPILIAIESKTTDKTSLSFTFSTDVKKTIIHAHQITGLWDAFTRGLSSGFLFNFREKEETYFLHIYDFMQFAKDTTKKSINYDDIKEYNGILIPQTKKRTKFTYDINTLIETQNKLYSEYKEKIPK